MQPTSAPMIVCMLSKRGHCCLKISCRKWIVALHYARQGIGAATKIFRSAAGRFAAVVLQGIAHTFQVDGPIITPSFWRATGRLWWRGCCLYRNYFWVYVLQCGIFVFIRSFCVHLFQHTCTPTAGQKPHVLYCLLGLDILLGWFPDTYKVRTGVIERHFWAIRMTIFCWWAPFCNKTFGSAHALKQHSLRGAMLRACRGPGGPRDAFGASMHANWRPLGFLLGFSRCIILT